MKTAGFHGDCDSSCAFCPQLVKTAGFHGDRDSFCAFCPQLMKTAGFHGDCDSSCAFCPQLMKTAGFHGDRDSSCAFCPQLMKTAGFHGDGYVELNSRRLKKTATFGFTFKTAVPNGLLMLSTFASKVRCNSASPHWLTEGLTNWVVFLGATRMTYYFTNVPSYKKPTWCEHFRFFEVALAEVIISYLSIAFFS